MKKIALTGPESSGKTSLALELCNLLDAVFVEEYARKYLEEKEGKYIPEDLDFIAGEQFKSAVNSLNSDKRFLFCDTEMHTIAIWSMEKYGTVSSKINDLLQKQEFDLYLLCRPDIPWQSDPLRENPHDRDRLFDVYVSSLQSFGRQFEVVEGGGNIRLSHALTLLRKHFKESLEVK